MLFGNLSNQKSFCAVVQTPCVKPELIICLRNQAKLPGISKRLKRSVLTNFISRVVKFELKAFFRPVVVTSDTHQEIAELFSKDIDGKGASVSSLAAVVFADALWNGTSFICVDAPVSMAESLTHTGYRRMTFSGSS